MTTFKVGDRVRFKPEYQYYAPEQAGKALTVRKVESDHKGGYLFDVPGANQLVFFAESALAAFDFRLEYAGPSPVPMIKNVKTYISLKNALEAAGGSTEVIDRLLEGSFEDAFAVFARNDIRFSYGG